MDWIFILVLFDCLVRGCVQASHLNLPMFPAGLFAKFGVDTSSKAVIPKHIWVAVKNSTEVLEWENIIDMKNKNPGWNFHVCDNQAKDEFMRSNFMGSKVLWAYENINPIVGGAARADIWRYAVLLLVGGVYIDSDSWLTKPLNDIIRPDDECLIGYETNKYEPDWCYSSHYRLSNLMQSKLYPKILEMSIFHNRMILNWCIMSAPHHAILVNALENFVRLVELEYIGLSAVKMQRFDVYSKHVYCTTGPFMFTASAREVVIQLNLGINSNKTSIKSKLLNGYRLASRDYLKEGALFKVINSNADSNHYTKVKDGNHFLSHYASAEDNEIAVRKFIGSPDMEGQLVMGRSKRNVYYLDKGIKRPVGGMDIFNAYNFSLVHIIHLSDHVMSLIPEGPALEMPSS